MAASMNFEQILLVLSIFISLPVKSLQAQQAYFGPTDSSLCEPPLCKVVQLNTTYNSAIEVKALPLQTKIVIFCYPGLEKTWHRLWANPKLSIKSLEQLQNWDVYYGRNVSDVMDNYNSQKLIRWPSLNPLRKQHSLAPFNESCIGLASTKGYTVVFSVKNPELWYLAYTVIGLLIFFFAPSWSRNTFFHYSSGVSFGVLAFILIAVFVVGKFLPQKLKTLTYVITVVSASVSMWIYHHVTLYLNDTLMNYWHIVLGYIAISGLVSFAVVYRYGPVTNPRSLDLVKWLLQFIGLLLIYQGSQISEMAVAIIIGAVLVYNFPVGMFRWLRKLRYRYFPPKTRLLTEEEFVQEGVEETRKALEDLKEYCRSPDCNAWKTMSRLTSPAKFASFIEGDSHYSNDELEEHDLTAEVNPLDLDDDSSESELSFRMTTR